MNHHLFLLFAPMLFWGCEAKKETQTSKEEEVIEKPVNIILMIGDGTGLSQISSAYYFGEGEPNYSRFKHIGLGKTSSGSHKITDSAAGATAYSAGKKTYNGAIGVDMDTNSVVTLVEEYSAEGWNTGVIATSSITHATPASFFAHVASRNQQEDIATQLITSDVDFFAGGGQKWFFDRSDSVNHYQALVDNGFVIDTASIDDKITDFKKKYGYLLAYDGMPTMQEGRGDFLQKATQKGLDYLTAKEKPFFLLVEGSQIDWGGHANIGEYVVEEVLDFDKTIGLVLDFAEQQGNTLVIVTADHETGGFTLSGEPKMLPYGKRTNDYNSIQPTFSTNGHSAAMVPVFAYGTGSENFQGIYENTNVHTLIRQLTGLE